MSFRLNRIWLLPLLLLGAQAWALGLGEIRLSSALNQPLLADIELLSATPEELNNLTVQLASAETFERYDLDRPIFLTRLDFDIIPSGRTDGNIIRITSTQPISEPFVTFLVEAAWTRGRLLREYTLLLDPPTFAPPPVSQASQTVTAPSRTTPADAGQIQRSSPPAQTAPQVSRPAAQQPAAPAAAQQPAPQNSGQSVAQQDFSTASSGAVVVQRGDTLWSIASRVRPDSRLSMNQTMLAIYQANPQAFAGNINVLRAGASLRIPSADDVFRIARNQAQSEVQRQNAAWGGSAGIAPDVAPDVAPADVQPSLTLVPPDDDEDFGVIDEDLDLGPADVTDDAVVDDVVDPVTARIDEIQAILDDQNSLINIPDNELAALRAELANLRGEEIPVDDVFVDTDDDTAGEEPVDTATTAEDPDQVATTAPPTVITAPQEEGIVATILGYFQNVFVWIGAALLVTVLILFWFMRRAANRDDEEVTGVWEALDADDVGAEVDTKGSTERLKAMAREDNESIVVVETQQTATGAGDDFLSGTFETPAADMTAHVETIASPAPAAFDAPAGTGTNQSLEDTFSSDTAINLDQSDPVAEADFHMAYGLYDQAADLINGALAADPNRQDLLAKLCEIYFVWGNRDGFVDGAQRLKGVVAGDANPDWDKIVIMGQQIAGDHELFSGVSAGGATKAVDLSFDGIGDDAGELDIDFAGGPDGAVSEVIDLGAEDDTGQVMIAPDSGDDIDFRFDEEADIEASITREMPANDAAEGTAEMPVIGDLESTAESPTIEQDFAMDATGEMPALSEASPTAAVSDATAEINLDDLGLDLGNLDETSVGGDIADDDLLADLDDTAESQIPDMSAELEETGTQDALEEIDPLAATGKNERLSDPDATGKNFAADFDPDDTGIQEALDVADEMAETGEMPTLDDDDATLLASLDDDAEDTDFGLDTSLLDATGQTQILTDDMVVDTASDLGAAIGDDAATLLAPLDDDDDSEFDFAKTEALPKDVFSSDMSTDETGRMPELAGSTDLDLDLDDLTAALKVSEVGDTINQMRDDATVEQPRLKPGAGTSATSVTQALAPEELSDDLHEARTMTEVGTKLDLARAYVDMGDPSGARSILEEVLDEGDEGQKQQAQQLLDSLPA